MNNRQLYTLKFKSSRLKEFDYDITLNFDEAKSFNEVIGLADSQMLRSIRDIRRRVINHDKLERLFLIRDYIRHHSIRVYKNDKLKDEKVEKINKRQNIERKDLLKQIQDKIYRTLYVSDYVTIVIEHPRHYEYIYKNGVMINGKRYVRLSCSAGQARVSTVVLCNEEIIDELERRLNNDRDLTQKITPSKFNAYFGLVSSATHLVSEPKFIVVKDFCNEATFMANYVTETDWDIDDEIEQKSVTVEMNRTDGFGLISERMAEVWSKDLEIDYIPSQFVLRQSFMKGLLCTFPIHEFCEKVNNGNYIVDTIYTDENENYIKADLRDYDVIITESQFKLWKGYKSLQDYIDSCRKNKLYWGVTQYSPKQDKDVLRLNYQFIQTLNLNQKDIEKLCDQFVNWINGVSYDNFAYMLLFLLGVNNDRDNIEKFLKSSHYYWIKALIIYPELKNDRYICGKIRELIKTKIQNGCMGEIFVDGNFQYLLSDPYGFMQHVCGLEVTGLLKEGEFYSNYWNDKSISRVDGMRSPLTFVSEHVVMDLRNDVDVNHWYRYCKTGFILNYYGHETVNFGGADMDGDILATSSNVNLINGVHSNIYPMHYTPPKPQAVNFTKDDLFVADNFGFGSIIGSITNKSSNAYALLPNLEKEYGKDSEQYKTTYSRLIQCCKAQSSQIDKVKIGRDVKGIPRLWVDYNKDKSENAAFYNSILLNKYPYFFKYRYANCRQDYNNYVDGNNVTAHQRFGKSLDDLINVDRHTLEEKEFVSNYYKYMPVTLSDSSMNLLCRHIESINFNIKQKIKSILKIDLVNVMKNKSVYYSEEDMEQVVEITKDIFEQYRSKKIDDDKDNDEDEKKDKIKEATLSINKIIDSYKDISLSYNLIVNCLIDYFYITYPKSNKDFLWSVFGKYIFQNLKMNLDVKTVLFPLPNDDGDIEYLSKKYALEEVEVD